MPCFSEELPCFTSREGRNHAFRVRNAFGKYYIAFFTEPDPDSNSYQPGPKSEMFITARFYREASPTATDVAAGERNHEICESPFGFFAYFVVFLFQQNPLVPSCLNGYK